MFTVITEFGNSKIFYYIYITSVIDKLMNITNSNKERIETIVLLSH